MPTLISTNNKTAPSKGIFALFRRGPPSAKVDESSGAQQVDFLRRFSDATLNEDEGIEMEEPALKGKKIDPMDQFYATVEKDYKAMMQEKCFRSMRWRVPAELDGSKALRQCRRVSSKTVFVLEKIGTMSYIVAKLA